MHVIMLSSDEHIYRAGTEVRLRMEAIAELFESLHIIVFSKKAYENESVNPKLFLYSAPAPISFQGFWHALKLAYFVVRVRRVANATILTSQDAVTHPIAFLLKYRFRLPLQVQVHTDFFIPAYRKESWKNFWRYVTYYWSVQFADCVRVVSRRIAQSLYDHFSRLPPVVVLPVAVDVENFRDRMPAFDPRMLYTRAYPVILLVGRLTIEKNFNQALEIAAELMRRGFPELIISVLGDGPLRGELQIKATLLGIQDHVRFEGWKDDLLPYYRGSDLLLFTSEYEGYGRVLIEAAASGLPIVSRPVGIVGEILRPEEHIKVFETSEEGVKAVSDILKNHELRRELRERAQDAISHLPTKEEALEAYEKALLYCR